VDLTDAIDLSVGAQHACVVRAAGGVVCWGDDTYGQLGAETPTTIVQLPGGGPIQVVSAETPVAVQGLP
jgi:hypothetical protein